MHSSNPFHAEHSSQHPQTDPLPQTTLEPLGQEPFQHPQLRSRGQVLNMGTRQPFASTAAASPLTEADAKGTWREPENGNGTKARALSQRQNPTSRSKCKSRRAPQQQAAHWGSGLPSLQPGTAQLWAKGKNKFVFAKAVQCKSRRWGDSSPAPGQAHSAWHP